MTGHDCLTPRASTCAPPLPLIATTTTATHTFFPLSCALKEDHQPPLSPTLRTHASADCASLAAPSDVLPRLCVRLQCARERRQQQTTHRHHLQPPERSRTDGHVFRERAPLEKVAIEKEKGGVQSCRSLRILSLLPPLPLSPRAPALVFGGFRALVFLHSHRLAVLLGLSIYRPHPAMSSSLPRRPLSPSDTHTYTHAHTYTGAPVRETTRRQRAARRKRTPHP